MLSQSIMSKTIWTGALAFTTASTQYSFPLTLLHVASKAGGGAPGHATMAPPWPDGGLQCRQLLRSACPVVAVARIWRTLPCGKWYDAAHAVGPQDCFASGFQAPSGAMRTSTLAMAGPFEPTLACTHHSLPRKPVNGASNPP